MSGAPTPGSAPPGKGSVGTAVAANALTPSELAAFLAELQEARLATVRADGDVHLTPVWYLAEPDGRLLVFLEERRLHLANLRRRPRDESSNRHNHAQPSHNLHQRHRHATNLCVPA